MHRPTSSAQTTREITKRRPSPLILDRGVVLQYQQENKMSEAPHRIVCLIAKIVLITQILPTQGIGSKSSPEVGEARTAGIVDRRKRMSTRVQNF